MIHDDVRNNDGQELNLSAHPSTFLVQRPACNPDEAVYAGSKTAVRAISEGLRPEAGDKLRVTTVFPGYMHTGLPFSMTDPGAREKGLAAMEKMAIPAAAIAEAIAFAIGQPDDVDVGEIVIRPTAQA